MTNHTFKVGDAVICTDASHASALITGGKYTITFTNEDTISVKGKDKLRFRASRFSLAAPFEAGDIIECINPAGYALIARGQQYIVAETRDRRVRIEGSREYFYPDSCFKFSKASDVVPFTLTIPTKTRDMTLTQKDGIAVISCGCFNGTLTEAYDLAESKKRTDYKGAILYLEEIAIIEGMTLEAPPPRTPKIGEVWANNKGEEYLVSSVPRNTVRFRFVNLTTGKSSPSQPLGGPTPMKFVRESACP